MVWLFRCKSSQNIDIFALLYIDQKLLNWIQFWFFSVCFLSFKLTFVYVLVAKKIFILTTVIQFIALYKTYVSWHGVCYCFVFQWNLLEYQAYSFFIQTFLSYHAFALFTCYCTLLEKEANWYKSWKTLSIIFSDYFIYFYFKSEIFAAYFLVCT